MYSGYCRPEIAVHELHRCGAPDALQETAADWHPCECDDDNEREGHESLDGAHMGDSVYCDGSCI